MASSRSDASVQMSMTGPYSGCFSPLMILPSANCLRTSCTTTPAVRPTARMASAENRNGTAPPISRPMKTFGSATLIGDRVEHAARGLLQLVDALDREDLAGGGLDEAGEQRDRGDDRGADGEALGDGLGGVADGVEADHDPLGLAVELAAHLGDAGGVVADRAERVLGHDDAGGGEHAHAA